jgi:hypothetical protein
VVSLASCPLNPSYPLKRRLGEIQIQPGLFGEELNQFHLPEYESTLLTILILLF